MEVIVRRVLVLGMLFATIGTGCVSGSVGVYGDSNIALNGTMPVATYGDRVRDQIAQLHEVVTFEPGPGKTQSTHPLNARLSSVSSGGFPTAADGTIDAVVIGLGTNDAVDFVYGNPTGYPVQSAVYQAGFYLERAAQSGAKCVVWILPNEINPYIVDDAQRAAASDYIRVFNGYLNGLPRTLEMVSGTAQFRTIDWGTAAFWTPNLSFDRMHPNAAGADYLGAQIRNTVGECIR